MFKAVLASLTASMALTGMVQGWTNHALPEQTSTTNSVTSQGASSSSNWYNSVYIQQVKENSHLRTYVYPRLEGLPNQSVERKLNAYLKKIGTPAPTTSHDSMNTTYGLLMQRGPLLELMMDSYDYPQGAAHGMPGQMALMINLSDGTVYNISDLFKSGANYLARLSNGVRAQDKQHVLDTFSKFTGVTKHDGYYLTNTGVAVFFSPYEWTPFALGFPTFTVPFEYLSSILNRQSSLWQAFNSPAAVAEQRAENADLRKIHSLGYAPLTNPTDSFAQTGTSQHQELYVWAAEPKAVTDGSVQKLFFFLGTRYLGTDTWRDHGPVYDLTPTGQGTISATYVGNVGENDFTIAYHWTGHTMKLTPAFPSKYKGWSNK